MLSVFKIYADGKLVFCDHIFNGYSSERKDFHKQMILSKQMAARGQYLPKDFHFRYYIHSYFMEHILKK